jgi:hypothetical protein
MPRVLRWLGFLTLLTCTPLTGARAQSAPPPAAPGVRLPPATGPVSSYHDWFGRPPVDRPKREWQKKKSGRVALFSSLLFPGLGQLYNERAFWTVVAAGVEFYFIADIIVQQRLTNHFRALKNLPIDPNDPDQVAQQQEYTVLFLLHRDNRVQSTWLLGLTILVSGLQAYVDAHLFDFDGIGEVRLEAVSGQPIGGALRLHF